MRLYIKQKVFSWTDKFNVTDENGGLKYSVEGELFTWGKKLHVYDAEGNEAAFIRQKVWSFLPRYHVLVNDVEVAEIVKEFTFFRPKYSIRGFDWQIDGNFFEHDYEIRSGNSSIATIHKRWMTWGDCYELDIASPADELLALCVVLTIDCVTEAQATASAAASSAN